MDYIVAVVIWIKFIVVMIWMKTTMMIITTMKRSTMMITDDDDHDYDEGVDDGDGRGGGCDSW